MLLVLEIGWKHHREILASLPGANSLAPQPEHVHSIDDARSFLSKTNQKYDIIVLDAYSKNYVPFHLMTLQYYQLLYDRLTTPNGVIVSNQLGSLDQEQDTSKLYRSVYKTMSQVFSPSAVYAFPLDVGNSNRVQNIMLVAIKKSSHTTI